ncbi:MAG: hypothetical protein GXP26_05030 [Planctomycetes bacterium]|nr:hypothetical protein [Planctomycetota bacterium]
MATFDSSQPLAVYFDEVFIEKHLFEPSAGKLKRFRNALGRASQFLARPVTYADVVDFASFRSQLIEELLRIGFTVSRAEAFAVCLREIRDAMALELKPERKQQPKRSNFAQFVRDYPLSIATQIDILFPDDDVCVHAVDDLETVQQYASQS